MNITALFYSYIVYLLIPRYRCAESTRRFIFSLKDNYDKNAYRLRNYFYSPSEEIPVFKYLYDMFNVYRKEDESVANHRSQIRIPKLRGNVIVGERICKMLSQIAGAASYEYSQNYDELVPVCFQYEHLRKVRERRVSSCQLHFRNFRNKPYPNNCWNIFGKPSASRKVTVRLALMDGPDVRVESGAAKKRVYFVASQLGFNSNLVAQLENLSPARSREYYVSYDRATANEAGTAETSESPKVNEILRFQLVDFVHFNYHSGEITLPVNFNNVYTSAPLQSTTTSKSVAHPIGQSILQHRDDLAIGNISKRIATLKN